MLCYIIPVLGLLSIFEEAAMHMYINFFAEYGKKGSQVYSSELQIVWGTGFSHIDVGGFCFISLIAFIFFHCMKMESFKFSCCND